MPSFGHVEAMQDAASSLLVPLRISAALNQPFHAEITNAAVGPMVIARICAPAGHARRTPQLIGSGDRRLVTVTIQLRGNAIITQGDRQSRARPGDLMGLDLSRPCDYGPTGPADFIVIAMPWSMLGPCGDLFAQRTAIAVPSDQGIRSVVGTFFGGLADTVLTSQDSKVTGPNEVRLADAAASLLITAFADIPSERIELPSSLTDRILSYALANLHDPGLSVGSAARRFGISPRYLHKLMRDRDIQFGAWVRRERMKRIRQDLLDPRLANRTAAVIAARWGVHDPDHLSRALRAEFGQSAAEIRTFGAR